MWNHYFFSFLDFIITYSSHFFFIGKYFLKKHLVVSLINLIPLLLYFNIVGVRPGHGRNAAIEYTLKGCLALLQYCPAISIILAVFWMITLTFDTIWEELIYCFYYHNALFICTKSRIAAKVSRYVFFSFYHSCAGEGSGIVSCDSGFKLGPDSQ